MGVLKHPLTLLTLLALLFFGDLVIHPDRVLYSDHSDFLSLHVPSKVFLVRSWQETGEVPLWDPHSFSGLPFIHDTQVSAFYPLHLPLFLLPVDWLGAALSWLVVLHVIAAGWCMYLYARSQGLEQWFAFVAALGYMFAGKWLIHVLYVGHYNMLPLAWLPLLLYWQDEAIRRGSLTCASLAGMVFALFVLCAYPYVTLYVGLFIALWTLAPVLTPLSPVLGGEGLGVRGIEPSEVPPPHPNPVALGAPPSTGERGLKLARWLLYGAWTALVGAALGAVQLLPSLEAAPHTTRSLGVEASMNMLRSGIESMVTLTGRGVVADKETPGSMAGAMRWEYEGGVGVIWLALAVLALALLRGRPRFYAAVAGILLAYAFGGAVLLQWLPGFRLFRLPSRMLLLLPLPLSLLAASTLQRLLTQPLAHGMQSVGLEARRVFLKILFALFVLQGGYVAARAGQGHPIHFHLYWGVLPITALAALWLLNQPGKPIVLALWVVILLVDLWSLTGRLAVVKPWSEIFTPSSCVEVLMKTTGGELGAGRIMARNPSGSYTTRTPLWPALPEICRLESIGGFNPTDVRRYKEYLQFITDVDEPLQPPQGNFTFPVLESFPVKNEKLLHLLGVRYLMQPVWEDAARTVPFALEGERPIQQVPHRTVTVDEQPHCFDMAGAGLVSLPPYAVYEYLDVLPRAFVVPEAKAMPDRPQVLEALKTNDFRRTVLLEDFTESRESRPAAGERSARITQYRPNRVVVEVGDGEAAYLVLTDIMFPGWTCTMNRQPTTLHRANDLFRAVAVPAEGCELVFTFMPWSYVWGKVISGASLAAAIFILVLEGARRRLAAKR